MTELVHTKDEFRGVGMIELINEPLHGGDSVETMRSKYYPDALNVSLPSPPPSLRFV